MELLLHQLSKPLVESMMISRGGFNHRVHNIVELNIQGKSFYSEVIGDSHLILFLFNRLSIFLKERDIKTLDYLYECVFMQVCVCVCVCGVCVRASVRVRACVCVNRGEGSICEEAVRARMRV